MYCSINTSSGALRHLLLKEKAFRASHPALRATFSSRRRLLESFIRYFEGTSSGASRHLLLKEKAFRIVHPVL